MSQNPNCESKDLTKEKWQALKRKVDFQKNPPNYDINTNNCADLVYNMLASVGLLY